MRAAGLFKLRPPIILLMADDSVTTPMLFMLAFVIAVQVLALVLTPSFTASDARVFENPSSPTDPLIYIVMIIIITGVLLLAMRLKRGWLVSGFVLISVASSILYVLSVFLGIVPAIFITGILILVLHYYPEWYVIDTIGILICAGISALFGISLTTVPAILLLVVLAVYDAISVYKTKHMVALAEGVINIKAPLLFVVPRTREYSFVHDQPMIFDREKGEGRGAFFLGMGDAIIPTILVISASWSLQAPGILGVNVPAMGAMLGTYLGFLALMTTSRDKPQAGLPFLNGGALLGFLLACILAGVMPS